MIKAKVSITKKRPAPGDIDFTSDAFSATLEVELPDAAFADGNGELKTALERLFAEVEDRVDAQLLNGHAKETSATPSEPQDRAEATDTPQTSNRPQRTSRGSGNGRKGGNGQAEPASNKQVNFLIGLAQRQNRMSLPELRAFCKRRTGEEDIYKLTKFQAMDVIDDLKNGG
jgi:hypothetical protein